MTKKTIQIGALIEFQGVECLVVDVRQPDVTLRDTATGQTQIASFGELADLLAVDETADGWSAEDLMRLPKYELEALKFLAGHLEEVLTGKHPDHEELDPSYSAGRSLEAKDAAKAKQLTRAGHPISARNIRRKRSAYARGGLAALIDRRGMSKPHPLARVPDEYRTAIEAEIRARSDSTTVTKRGLRLAVEQRVEAEPRSGDCEHPEARTLNKWIALVDANSTLNASARHRNSLSNRPGRKMWRSRPAISPGHEVQVDSSKLDVLCRTGDGGIERATLVVMMDKRTRSIIASGLYVTNKGIDLVHLLARALRPRIARMSRYEFPKSEIPPMPWSKHLSREQLEQLDERVPFIYPQRIIMDNGSDYRSDVFRSACEGFGIDLSIAPPASPTYKAVVEHFFTDVNDLFCQYLPGYINRNVTERARRSPDPDSLLSIDEVADLFEEWVTVIWQNRQHGGLIDPRERNRLLTPNQMYFAASELSDPVPLPISEDQYIGLLSIELRKIRPDGIWVSNRRYDSPQLAPFRGQKSGDVRHGNLWEVRCDPWDMSVVWVRDTINKRWIECEIVEGEATGTPFATKIRKQQRALQKVLPRLDNEEAGRQVHAIIQALPESESQRGVSVRRDARIRAERRRSGVPESHALAKAQEPTREAVFDPNDFVDMALFDPEGPAR